MKTSPNTSEPAQTNDAPTTNGAGVHGEAEGSEHAGSKPQDGTEGAPNDQLNPQQDAAATEEEAEQALIDREYRELRELVTIPYLPPLSDMNRDQLPKRAKNLDEIYTLVLDLDETLIHFEIDEDVPDDEEPGYYLIRPGALRFLSELSEYFEIVVFTAAMPDVSFLFVLQS